VHAAKSLPTNQTAQLAAELKVLVCREICVPGKAQISLTIPIKSIAPEVESKNSGLFTMARKSLPQPLPRDWKLKVADQKDSIILTANLGKQTTRATFFPLEESQVDNSAPQKLVSTANGFQLKLQKSDQLLKPIKRLKGVLELSVDRAYGIDVPVGD